MLKGHSAKGSSSGKISCFTGNVTVEDTSKHTSTHINKNTSKHTSAYQVRANEHYEGYGEHIKF